MVRAQGGQVITTDGPFAETKEQLGGFWIIDVADLDAALEWARKATAACAAPVEVRPFPGDPGGLAVPGLDTTAVERAYRESSGRAVATLVRLFGDIDLAEEAVQEAFTVAVQRWAAAGVPPNPGGWIVTAARNKALDRLRRESSRYGREAQAALLRLQTGPGDLAEPAEVEPVPDDRLRLIFTCCHPALGPEAQLALTLRLVAGLQTPQIARAFLVPEATSRNGWSGPSGRSATRGSRTGCPRDAELTARLPFVLAVVYLVFNEGYTASAGGALIRSELCAEAIRLARLLAGLMPDEPEVLGLLALLLLTEARRPARTATDGVPGPAGRPGSQPVGPGPDRRGPEPGARVPAP